MIVVFNKETRTDILKDIITKTQLKMVEIKQTVKKPTTVGQKYWEIAWKLTQYGANFINLP